MAEGGQGVGVGDILIIEVAVSGKMPLGVMLTALG